jgi:uncharacterized protein (DUF4415 family)
MNKLSSSKTKTDWDRVDALAEKDIDLSDNPEVTPEMFAKAVVRRGLVAIPPKEQVTLRLDSDVLKWFRSQGKGYQTQINALLRAYVEARLKAGKKGSEEEAITFLRSQPWIRPGSLGKKRVGLARPIKLKPGEKTLSEIVSEMRD